MFVYVTAGFENLFSNAQVFLIDCQQLVSTQHHTGQKNLKNLLQPCSVILRCRLHP